MRGKITHHSADVRASQRWCASPSCLWAPRPTIQLSPDLRPTPVCQAIVKNKAKKTRAIRGNVSHGKGRIGELPARPGAAQPWLTLSWTGECCSLAADVTPSPLSTHQISQPSLRRQAQEAPWWSG